MLAKNLNIIAVTLIMLLGSSTIVPAAKVHRQESAPSYRPVGLHDHDLFAAQAAGDYVIEATDEGAVCRDATLEESQSLAGHDQLVPLHLISPVHPDEVTQQDAGLNIVLRSTQQLENFPQAKNAFLRAAQTWQQVIRSPITMIIDVDFGPTRFGIPYPGPNTLGSTGAQNIGASSLYPAVRSSLISGASSIGETALYNALPGGSLQTDIGGTTAMLAPSAVFRALGIIGPVANPASETNLGPPPSVGFNSAFQFDFDPSNGIDPGKIDFDAVAVHEIGHALGFFSNVGSKELNPGVDVAPSVLDLLRFRPGVTLATFSTALRIQSSGGSQVFFAGGPELAMSTGRGDASGGDGRQASHWKDDELIGQNIGIMDPTLSPGQRKTITNNDLLALDAMGYKVGESTEDTKALTSGVPQSGSIDAPDAGSALLGSTQYTVQVPNGASQLTVELNGNPDVDLYVRGGQRITIGSSGPVADHVSDSQTGSESITINTSSSPPLRVGTYYIAVGNYGPGAASFNVKATITGGGGGNSAPVITSLQADLDGDKLKLTGVVADPDGDIVQAQSSLLNASGQVVGETEPFAVNLGNSPTINFTLTITNLNSIPAAMQASLTFIDRRGNRSPGRVADFSGADSGGPTVSNVSYSGSKLAIKGSGFSSQLLIEINGEVVGIVPSASGKKIKVKGNSNQLNLQSGPNRLRIYNGSTRSNLFVLNL